MATTSARVLVVEDDTSIRHALDAALRNAGYQTRAERDGTRLQEAVREFNPDLAILDVWLPVGPDGLYAARILRRLSDLPVLFLTAADSLDDRLAGFAAGGDDYLGKPFSMEELLARVDALLRRSGRLSSSVSQLGDLAVDHASRTAVRGGRVVELTPTEHGLLTALVRHPGQVVSKVQLLTQVWGADAHDTNLVEVHMSSLRRKLEVHGPRLVHTVRGVGYTLRP